MPALSEFFKPKRLGAALQLGLTTQVCAQPFLVKVPQGSRLFMIPPRDNQCIERDRAWRAEEKDLAQLQERFETLTPREQEVMRIVISGRPNKQIAAELKLSEMTVKIHRSQLMRKMRAKSLVELVRMADTLKVSAKNSPAT